MTTATYNLWVSDNRCTLVRVWSNGTCEVCTRSDPNGTWGPPITMLAEEV